MCRTLQIIHLPFALLLAVTAPALAADMKITMSAGDGMALLDNTSTIERWRLDEATGNISRNGALFVHTTGAGGNTFVGASAGGNQLATGYFNAGFGNEALLDLTTGDRNSAFGRRTLRANTAGYRNSAFGDEAMRLNTTGDRNSAFGSQALRSNPAGDGNSAFGYRALRNNSTSFNSAFGYEAMYTTSTGANNSAFGSLALRSNTTGINNSAFGRRSLYSNDIGENNSAFGLYALEDNTSGNRNSGFGRNALRNVTTGVDNVGIGVSAGLDLTTGSENIFIGENSGDGVVSGSNNVFIGTDSVFSSGTNNRVQIGNSSTTTTNIGGIFGRNITGGTDVPILVNTFDEVGTTASSARFKQDVDDMGASSELLMKLRPVTFRYREAVRAGSTASEYGLIAEEVAEIAPELVALDEKGDPYTVRYHVLPSLLLNEIQKQQKTIDKLLARVDELEQQRGGEHAAMNR